MPELESLIEQKLIEQLIYGDSQWTYRSDLKTEYYGAAEPPVRCGESHLSGLTEPPHFVY